jgi:hypothetical protein
MRSAGMAVVEPGAIESELSQSLREAVLAELREQKIDPDALAAQLDLVPTSVRAVLKRETWPLRTALVMADGLRISVHVTVTRQPS